MNIRMRLATAAWLALSAAAGAALSPAAAATSRVATAKTVASHELLPDIEARVGSDGTVRFLARSTGAELLLVEAPGALDDRGRIAPAAAPFTGRFREGDERGQRGFAPRADDDGDGRIDEDRADGLDNDSDGRTDEDFAAISDAMAVVHLSPGGRHLETYRWAYPHLRSTLFVSWQKDGAAGGDGFVVDSRGPAWHDTDLTWHVGPDGAAPEARRATMVATATGAAEEGADRVWLGIVRLPDEAVPAREPLRLDGRRLDVRLDGGRVALAISAARTLMQLRFNLAQALVVHRGATGLPEGGSVPWIVPPLRSAWLSDAAPRLRCEQGENGEGWRLVVQVSPGEDALLDPCLLLLAGRPLGAPRAVGWEPASGAPDEGWVAPWKPIGAESLSSTSETEQDPFVGRQSLRQGRAEGRLLLHFAGSPPAGGDGEPVEVEGRLLCGRTFRAEVACAWPGAAGVAGPGTEPAADAKRLARQDTRNIPLSPQLLENYPNPFRSLTRVRFRVPSTVGEAFAGSPGDETIPLDPDSPVPYRSAPPQISLRVYSLIGQEIRTLHTGALGPGQYETVWDGSDQTGRAVASGTYFCKLQIEAWSVTKRIVFLR